MKVLVANVGSTSFKYQLFDMGDESVLARGKVERVGSERAPLKHRAASGKDIEKTIDAPNHNAAIAAVMELLLDPQVGAVAQLGEIAAVGFKTVHAGKIAGSVLITEEIMRAQEECVPLAPAHNPPYIKAIRAFQDLMPGTPLVGVFEPFFHQTIPQERRIYGIPYAWYEKYGIRRLGFHGSSHCYVAQRVPHLLGQPPEGLRIISCHLGGSSSITAIKDGHSVDTSMGFTAQTGVSHSSRCGDIDPFIIPFMMDQEGWTTAEITRRLTRESGLLGISGLSGDVRDLEEAAAAGNERAALALSVFVHEVRKYIGAYIAVLGGLDALAFAGGIGENGRDIRRRICQDLEFLGIELDAERNALGAPEGIISREGAPVKVLVVPTNEEIIVARETARVVGAQ